MTPITDLPTLQSPVEPPQFEIRVGTPHAQVSTQSDLTIEKPVSAAKNTDKLSLTEDSNIIEPEGTAEETNIESLAGMLDDLYDGETLPRLSELDVAFEMDEVNIVEEEPWDDNDSNSDADIDGGVSEYERE